MKTETTAPTFIACTFNIVRLLWYPITRTTSASGRRWIAKRATPETRFWANARKLDERVRENPITLVIVRGVFCSRAMGRVELRLAALRLIDESAFSNPLWGISEARLEMRVEGGQVRIPDIKRNIRNALIRALCYKQ